MHSAPANIPNGFEGLKERLGEERLRRRLHQQSHLYASLSHQGEGIFKIERFISINLLAKRCLQAALLWRRAHANIFKIETVEQEWHIPNLPQHFDHFRLLQLTDLHIDIDPALSPAIAEAVKRCPHDALVITGDYRDSTSQDHNPAMELIKPVLDASAAPKFGILGNHDFIEKVWQLETLGLPILLNQARPLERNGQQIWIAGVDDPHFYKTHDFAAAREGIPADACTILLCHSPEVHKEAADYGFDLMLSGHTHAGQICLPGGRHLVLPVKGLQKPFIKGRWRSGQMQGYTSRGTGSCGVAARLNCRPEMTLHILRTDP